MRPQWQLTPIKAAVARASLRPSSVMLAEGALVAIVAGVLRYNSLQRTGYNSDEAVYSGQAAAIAGFQPYGQLFGIFRAHPLLVHFLLALGYQVTGVNDWLPRVVTATFGVALALLCWATARLVLGQVGGLAAGLVAAACPYAVTVSRQVLLDGPMATFVALTLFLFTLWLATRQISWLYAAAAAAGLAFLAKETAVLLLPAVLVAFAFSRELPPTRRRDLPLAALVYLVTISPYPLSLALAGGSRTTGQFLAWQFVRRPNHDPTFYLGTIPAIGYVTVALAILGLVTARRRWHPLATLQAGLLVGNLAFFQAWPTKGFQYLIPLVPSLAYFAGEGVTGLGGIFERLARDRPRPAIPRRLVAPLAIALTVCSLLVGGGEAVAAPVAQVATDSDGTEAPAVATGLLAGAGGLEAGRPAGQWVRAHTLASAQFITIGPSFANVIEFYGQRRARALSVSINPLRRNPTYEPIRNPDATIRNGGAQYLVYDAYSAARAPFFARQLLTYVKKFSGASVYEYQSRAGTGRDRRAAFPAVVIYQVYS